MAVAVEALPWKTELIRNPTSTLAKYTRPADDEKEEKKREWKGRRKKGKRGEGKGGKKRIFLGFSDFFFACVRNFARICIARLCSRRKYKKLRHKFRGVMKRSDELFRHEQMANLAIRRIQEKNT